MIIIEFQCGKRNNISISIFVLYSGSLAHFFISAVQCVEAIHSCTPVGMFPYYGNTAPMLDMSLLVAVARHATRRTTQNKRPSRIWSVALLSVT